MIIKNEDGVAMVEAAIVIPLFLVFALFGIIEVGAILHSHQNLTGISKVVAKKATLIGGLAGTTAPGDVFETTTDTTCADPIPAGPHASLHTLACQLLKAQNFDIETSVVTTTFENIDCASVTSVGVAPTSNCASTISIKLEGDYSSFTGFQLFKVGSRRTAPYLLKSS